MYSPPVWLFVPMHDEVEGIFLPRYSLVEEACISFCSSGKKYSAAL